ncbi:MAG: class I SAM-dependent methyltransferase [Gammaproteobacteria bacterium]|nr:class I SAM-dependent methyltransferase [Gammaproteobacteria bacterium]
MNIEMYRIFFKIQNEHWWFITKKKIVLSLITRLVPINKESKILDIGCGSGLMLNALGELGQTYGMDISDEAIGFSKEIFKGQVMKGALPDEVPYQENFFNLITALDVVEHVEEDIKSLIALRARLCSGGKAIITVPAYMFLWSAFDEINEHKRRYTLSELKEKLLQAGFTIEKISYYNTLLFPIVYVVRVLNNIFNRDGSSDVDMPSQPMNFILKKIFGVEKYMLRFFNLPFGVSILAVVKKC